MAWSLWRSRHSSGSFGPHISLLWSIATLMLASYTLPCILVERCLGLGQARFSLTSPGHTASGSNGTITASTEAQFTLTPSTDIVWVFHESLNYGTARLVDPQHTVWAQDNVSADTIAADNTGVLARFLEDNLAITKDQDLGLLHVETEPFTFHANLLPPELGDTLPLGDRYVYQDISIEELPYYTSRELTP